jgi:thymidylate synthase
MVDSDEINWEHRYKNLVKDILVNGEERKGRNGITKSLFGKILKVDVKNQGFPILQGRKMYYEGVFGELAAMLHGAQTVQEFEKHGCNYWKSWADKDGKLNIDYGRAWKDFNGVNQLDELIHKLRKNPNDRRMIISGWRPDKLEELSLPCCHLLYQWYVRDGNILDMIWYQRSVDTMIGLPSDIIFAAAWNMVIATQVGMIPGELTFMLGDTHIYEQHYNEAFKYIKSVEGHYFKYINSYIDRTATVHNFNKDMLTISSYRPQKSIKFELIK